MEIAEIVQALCRMATDYYLLRNRSMVDLLKSSYRGPRRGARPVAPGRLPECGRAAGASPQRKGGKEREIPVRHDLEAWLEAYIAAADIDDEPKTRSLFHASAGKRRVLTADPYGAHSMRLMLKRRLKDAGLPDLFSPHSFRVAVVTDLLNQNGPMEDVQYLAGHSSPKTTQIYDRRRPRVTRNIVERISI